MKVYKHTMLSLLAVLLFTATSLLDILWAKTLYRTPEVHAALLPSDVVNLFIGIAALSSASVKKLRNSLFALPLRSALLLFIIYHEIAAVYAIRSAMSIILLLVSITAFLTLVELPAYQQLLNTSIPVRRPKIHATILIAMALFFIIRSLVTLFGTDATSVQRGVSLSDLLICSLWLANGLGFFRNSTRCLLAAFICYINGSLLFASLLLFLILQPIMLGLAPRWLDILVVGIMSLAFFIPTSLLGNQIRKATAREER